MKDDAGEEARDSAPAGSEKEKDAEGEEAVKKNKRRKRGSLQEP